MSPNLASLGHFDNIRRELLAELLTKFHNSKAKVAEHLGFTEITIRAWIAELFPEQA